MTNGTSVLLIAKIHQQGEFSIMLQQYELWLSENRELFTDFTVYDMGERSKFKTWETKHAKQTTG